jgi:hypothetical protein
MRHQLPLALAAMVFATPVLGQTGPAPDAEKLVMGGIAKDIRTFLSSPIVALSIGAQNEHHKNIDMAEIEKLDKQWVEERKVADKPLIAATLTSPLSIYLLRVQAGSLGLYSEIFVADAKGLNVGQSSVTSDYWQGDEAKYRKTFPLGPDAVFLDKPEFHKETGTWRAQLNLTIADPHSKVPIGIATVEVNLTEAMRRLGPTS